MKIAITGATGFLGSHLARACHERGDEITILRRSTSRMDLLQGVPCREVIGDLGNPAALCDAFRGADLVFHVAALIGYWKKIVAEQHEVNVIGTRNVVQACLQENVGRLVHTSSVVSVAYSRTGKVHSEEAAYNCGDLRLAYADTKHQAEEEVRRAVGRGLDAVLVNPSVIFGPIYAAQNSSQFLEKLAREEVPCSFPGGINAVGVDDVVSGHLLAAEKGKTGERYILAGENFYYRDLCAKVAELAGVRAPAFCLPEFAARFLALAVGAVDWLVHWKPPFTPELFRSLPITFFFSSEKAIRDLGYRPHPVDFTIQRTLESLRRLGKIP